MTDNDIGLLEAPELITRREAVLRVTALLGGIALTGGTALITGCRQEKVGEPFTPDEIAYLDEIADTILPTTSTPGAKAAKTGAFMALMVKDTYEPKDDRILQGQVQRRFHEGNAAAATRAAPGSGSRAVQFVGAAQGGSEEEIGRVSE